MKLVIGHKFHPLLDNNDGQIQMQPHSFLQHITPLGRPKKSRRREVNENVGHSKARKKSLKMKCNKCNQYGHNIRGCRTTKTDKV